MEWKVEYLEEALINLKNLDRNLQIKIIKKINKVKKNPLPKQNGGYGLPLGNKHNMNLSGLNKIVLMSDGVRVVYKLLRFDNIMKIIVISARADLEVYKIAHKRK